ncbi:DUF937 domain-containing protein [Leucobacter rhizosphaerae]|uniref:DUF937 domain-containing protein n=1 Tax=Leucobacter rhizosphaerae TaxID=2932245 RepID=A0ABY4FZN1_9MICO|nr:DUF937 domain-containing protein [Leucobacter rhizosphaerae]UOQ61772.1 DUF937 domain-containing protein [Leucobacter rhizosphaerae]
MASSSDLDALLQQIPMGELAQRFGVDESTIDAAVRQALPGLVGGMAVNASDRDGAEKLERALQRHEPAAGSLDLNAIDTEDGGKIVSHVLGDKQESVTKALGAQSGSSVISDLLPQLLPILAPLVMQFLAGKLGGAGSAGSGTTPASGDAGGLGGVLGDLLGGLLGGGSAPSGSAKSGSAQGSDGGLGDVLGGLLGGGSSQQSSGGGLGDLLGGLLGGRK